MTDYDGATAFLGQWGRFQLMIFCLLCVSMVPNGMISFQTVFLVDIPNHQCLIPEVNLTQEWHNATIPKEVIRLITKLIQQKSNLSQTLKKEMSSSNYPIDI